jgi:hypothetical protein
MACRLWVNGISVPMYHEVIADPAPNRHSAGMEQTSKDVLFKAVARLPEWVRHDLAAKDAALRVRAEESLAAILVDALDRASDGKA